MAVVVVEVVLLVVVYQLQSRRLPMTGLKTSANGASAHQQPSWRST